MIKGFYAAASAMLANMERQQTLAHNAANLETVGFKQIMTSMNDFVETSYTFSPGNVTHSAQRQIGNLGLGSKTGAEITDFVEGGIKHTGNTYDLAINGNSFFRVNTPEGERYTRDGRFLRDAQNQLVTASNGYHVLDENGQPITLPDGDPGIGPDGTININGQVVGKLGLAAFANPVQEMTRAGGNLFSASNAPSAASNGAIEQGALEMSNVNVSYLTTQMVMVTRSYEAAQKMVTTQDQMISRTIDTLGRL